MKKNYLLVLYLLNHNTFSCSLLFCFACRKMCCRPEVDLEEKLKQIKKIKKADEDIQNNYNDLADRAKYKITEKTSKNTDNIDIPDILMNVENYFIPFYDLFLDSGLPDEDKEEAENIFMEGYNILQKGIMDDVDSISNYECKPDFYDNFVIEFTMKFPDTDYENFKKYVKKKKKSFIKFYSLFDKF